MSKKYIGTYNLRDLNDIKGPPGADGQPTYTWVVYADDEQGNGLAFHAEGKQYIGLSFNQTDATPSDNPNDYEWSLLPQNIVIGGRNLVLDSAGMSDFSGWGEIGGADEEYDSLVHGKRYRLSEKITPGTDYVFTYQLNSNSGQTALFLGASYFLTWLNSGEAFRFQVDEEFEEQNIVVRSSNGGGSFGYPQLEEGTSPSAWSPAPEDYYDRIEDIQTGGKNLVLRSGELIDFSRADVVGTSEQYFGNNYLLDSGKAVDFAEQGNIATSVQGDPTEYEQDPTELEFAKQYDLAEPLKLNTDYTLSVEGEIDEWTGVWLGKDYFAGYLEDGWLTFQCPADLDPDSIIIKSLTDTATIDRVMLNEGASLPWEPNSQDYSRGHVYELSDQTIEGRKYVLTANCEDSSCRFGAWIGSDTYLATILAAEPYFFTMPQTADRKTLIIKALSEQARLVNVQLERGTLATDYKPSPYDTKIPLGGENLLARVHIEVDKKLNSSTGGVASQLNSSVSGVIAVEPLAYYTLSVKYGEGSLDDLVWAFYDSDGGLLTSGTGEEEGTKSLTVRAPDGADSFRMSANSASNMWWKMEKGEINTPWSPAYADVYSDIATVRGNIDEEIDRMAKQLGYESYAAMKALPYLLNIEGKVRFEMIESDFIVAGHINTEYLNLKNFLVVGEDGDGNPIDSFIIDSDGNATITGTMKSSNYVEGASPAGWQIDVSGNAVLNQAVVRGSVRLPSAGMTDENVNLSNSEEDKVRFYAGETYENRKLAPFRVLENGNVYINQGILDGTFTGELHIGNIEITDKITDVGTETDDGRIHFKYGEQVPILISHKETRFIAPFGIGPKGAEVFSVIGSVVNVNNGTFVVGSPVAERRVTISSAASPSLITMGTRYDMGFTENEMVFGGKRDLDTFLFKANTAENASVQVDGNLSVVKQVDVGGAKMVYYESGANKGVDIFP